MNYDFQHINLMVTCAQDEWMRRAVLSIMKSLQQHKLIGQIPQKFERDAPRIKLLLLSVAGRSLQELTMDKLGEEWVEVPEGEDFMIKVIAERSGVGCAQYMAT